MTPAKATSPWRKTLRREARGIPTGRRTTHRPRTKEPRVATTVIHTASGRTKRIDAAITNVVGLDRAGRIVVDHFGAMDKPVPAEYKFSEAPFVFALTLCCNASDKGTDSGVVCRGCYGTKRNADEGAYLYRGPSGDFDGLDPLVCTPDKPCEEGWTDGWDANGHEAPYTCRGCGRTATDAEADAEGERRFDASLPAMEGYAEQ